MFVTHCLGVHLSVTSSGNSFGTPVDNTMLTASRMLIEHGLELRERMLLQKAALGTSGRGDARGVRSAG